MQCTESTKYKVTRSLKPDQNVNVNDFCSNMFIRASQRDKMYTFTWCFFFSIDLLSFSSLFIRWQQQHAAFYAHRIRSIAPISPYSCTPSNRSTFLSLSAADFHIAVLLLLFFIPLFVQQESVMWYNYNVLTIILKAMKMFKILFVSCGEMLPAEMKPLHHISNASVGINDGHCSSKFIWKCCHFFFFYLENWQLHHNNVSFALGCCGFIHIFTMSQLLQNKMQL